MPYKNAELNRRRARENMRRLRATRKAEREATASLTVETIMVDDPGKTIADWSKRCLVVPPGHPLAGENMELPDFMTSFLSDALRPGIQEAGIWVSRKNSKSAGIAVAALAHLVGPLRRRGWRCALVSITKGKAALLRSQIEEIAKGSGIEDIRFRRSPFPGKIESEWGTIETLSAERHEGHAAGYHVVFVDETGLLQERDRALLAGLRSSISAHRGRLIHISIRGNGIHTDELSARKDDPAVVVHEYAADANARLDDAVQWHKANPALKLGIKDMDYMRAACRRAQGNPSEARFFRAFDLNMKQDPGAEMIVGLDDWLRCVEQPEAPRIGPAFVGFDLGYVKSFTSAAAYWPETSRLECYAAVGGIPDVMTRGEGDGVGDRYERMLQAGLLRVIPGVKVTPVAPFLEWFVNHLDGVEVIGAAADRVRRAEAEQALADSGVGWEVDFRASGMGVDGIADVLAFQNAVASEQLRPAPTPHLLLESAIEQSKLRFDGNGNCVLDKSSRTSRIDALSASILAVGLGERSGVAGFSLG